MRYSENRDASAEILRLAIAEMAKHDAAFTPINYTVWYECLGGINRPLRRAVDQVLGQHAKLDDGMVKNLFHLHVLGRAESVNLSIQEKFSRLLDELSGLVHNSTGPSAKYSEFLQECQQQLEDDTDPLAVAQVIESLLRETVDMRVSFAELQRDLQRQALEVETLRQSLMEAVGAAMIDPLTGLLNRRGFNQRLDEELSKQAEQPDRPLSLILVDIDHFKQINDNYGHLFGDQVIRSLGDLLAHGAKQFGAVGRWGGEEFAVLLPNSAAGKACAVAENLRNAMARASFRRPRSAESIGVTISLGVAAYFPGESSEEWLNRADLALYASKNGGRNRVSINQDPSTAVA